MFYDLIFELGGEFLVRIAEAFISPVFAFVCSMAEAFGNQGFWETFATLLERILS